MKKILLVDDSKEIFNMVSRATDSLGVLKWAENILEARELLGSEKFDIILLDIELPDGNGVDFCTEINAKHLETPIFFLTCHETLSDKVLGFSAGADDYITKPFAILELKARIEAKFKKMDLVKKTSDILKWEELKINKSGQEVFYILDGECKKVDLTSLEFKLLMYFASKPHEVINRDEILDKLWGEDVHVYSRSVDTHVSKLRKKLGPVSQIIESVHGAGYKFNPTLTV